MSIRSTLRAGARQLITLGRGVLVDMPEATEQSDPFDLFERWFRAAVDSGVFMPEAMTLATATPDGRPSARVVLLKGHGPDGFVFYTNYASRKGRELEANPRAALVLSWEVLTRQIRIEGRVERTDGATSDAYFRSRPRDSRIGAWASHQSETLPSRGHFDSAFDRFKDEFTGGEVPRPEFWGGYRLVPDVIEFWQGRAFRLHDRVVFERSAEGPWAARRLYP